jgi:hypothetical protein
MVGRLTLDQEVGVRIPAPQLDESPAYAGLFGLSRADGRTGDMAKRSEAWVKHHCAEQGVPVKLSDPLLLAEIAEILCSARDKRTSEER